MTNGDTYRIATPTLAIVIDDDQRSLVTIPASAVVQVVQALGTMIAVEFDGKPVMMFAVDLFERSQLINRGGTVSGDGTRNGNGDGPAAAHKHPRPMLLMV